jgi:tripartite-type tricarboxylate transporter receptor subunit TctC
LKRFVFLALAAALVVPHPVLAQAFPAKPVRIICPLPPGGGVDITARAIAQELSALLGQPVVVENKPGAGGNVAAGDVARAAPDGHTLLLTLNALHAISPHLYAKLPFDAMKDFSFITPLVSFNNVLVVSPAATARSVQDLIAAAKREPGKLTFASSGNGTNIHLVGELFKAMARIDIVHVPYKG